jgi:hypothetical protein
MFLRIVGELPQEVRDSLEDLLDEAGVEWSLENLPDPGKDKSLPYNKGSKTSKAAAKVAYPRAGTHRWHVMWAFAQAGERGLTRDEVYAIMKRKIPKMKKSGLDARVWELGERNLGYITPNGKMRPTNTGSQAEVLILSASGAEAMKKFEK